MNTLTHSTAKGNKVIPVTHRVAVGSFFYQKCFSDINFSLSVLQKNKEVYV